MRSLILILAATILSLLTGCVTPHPALSVISLAGQSLFEGQKEQAKGPISIEELLSQAVSQSKAPSRQSEERLSLSVSGEVLTKTQVQRFAAYTERLLEKGTRRVNILTGTAKSNGQMLIAFKAMRLSRSLANSLSEIGFSVVVIHDPGENLASIEIIPLTVSEADDA